MTNCARTVRNCHSLLIFRGSVKYGMQVTERSSDDDLYLPWFHVRSKTENRNPGRKALRQASWELPSRGMGCALLESWPALKGSEFANAVT